MPPRAKGQAFAPPAAGPHGGQASIRKAYETLGVQHFYALHGARYTNPHEAQIFAILAQLLDSVPAAVWLGRRELAPDVAATDGGGNDSDEGLSDDDVDNNGGSDNGIPGGGGGGGDNPSNNLRQRQAFHGACPGHGAASSDPALPTSGAGATGSVHNPEATMAAAVVSGLMPPVPLRVLDLACGSGEATAAIVDWNRRHPVSRRGVTVPPHLGPAGRPPEAVGAAAIVTSAAAATATATATASAGQGGAAGQRNHHASVQQAVMAAARMRRVAAGKARSAATTVADVDADEVLPYELRITACDPYTGAAYQQRTGRSALTWSFEDIADGCLADWEEEEPPPLAAARTSPAGGPSRPVGPPDPPLSPPPPPPLSGPPFDLAVCSFALHLCEPSRLYATLTALSLSCRWLAVLAPHKRPRVGAAGGWRLVAASRVERTHLRLYRSTRVPEGVPEGVTVEAEEMEASGAEG